MGRWRWLALLAPLALPAAPAGADGTPPPAQAPCGERRDIVSRLQSIYGESQVGLGIADSGALLELFVGAESFTIIATFASGRSCLLATGTSWEQVTAKRDRGV